MSSSQQASSVPESEPLQVNKTHAILADNVNIDGWYLDKAEVKTTHTLHAGSEVIILAYKEKRTTTRVSTGVYGPEVEYEYALTAELPEKAWKTFLGVGFTIEEQRIPHTALSLIPTSHRTKSTPKSLGEMRRDAFWTENEFAYVRKEIAIKVGRNSPTGLKILNLGDCVKIRSSATTIRNRGRVPEELTDHNFNIAAYDFQFTEPEIRIPTWTSYVYHTARIFEETFIVEE
ncbi:hypothetical protein CVT25_000120 [Psilocybe cyanescens]|uniref:Uncharacterized protein n=1 Tax=Psilocybe cyanescens TaxID=93625 RepID=A0A409WZ86_PSICY|nr:hypothetical protein CVT25_000120 [Psilocybe cyanescens]